MDRFILKYIYIYIYIYIKCNYNIGHVSWYAGHFCFKLTSYCTHLEMKEYGMSWSFDYQNASTVFLWFIYQQKGLLKKLDIDPASGKRFV